MNRENLPAGLTAFRNFTMWDFDGCAKLYIQAFNAPPWNDRWTVAAATKRLKDLFHTPGFIGLVAEQGQAVGMVLGHIEQWFDGPVFYLREICVEPSRQGQGVGKALMRELTASLETMGVKKVYLLTNRNNPSETFFAAHGIKATRGIIMMSGPVQVEEIAANQ